MDAFFNLISFMVLSFLLSNVFACTTVDVNLVQQEQKQTGAQLQGERGEGWRIYKSRALLQKLVVCF